MRLTATLPLCLKLAGSPTQGEFAGIAATWQIDRHGEQFARGAFAKSLASWGQRGGLPPLLWQHDTSEPIGALTSAKETAAGLEVTGRIVLTTPNGRRAHELLSAGGGALGLSVGFQTLEYDTGGVIPTHKEVDWVELSLVSVPAQPGAVVTDVKSAFPDRKTFEHAARNALGLSREQAKRLAAGGFAAMVRDDPETDPQLTEALRRFANH